VFESFRHAHQIPNCKIGALGSRFQDICSPLQLLETEVDEFIGPFRREACFSTESLNEIKCVHDGLLREEFKVILFEMLQNGKGLRQVNIVGNQDPLIHQKTSQKYLKFVVRLGSVLF